jgi:hypothetical protein
VKTFEKHALVLASVSAVITGCIIAPVSANYETAKTLGKGNVEVMGNYTRYHSTYLDGGLTNQNLGIRLGVGLSENFDLKFRYERLIEPKYEFDFLGVNSETTRHAWDFFRITPKWCLRIDEWAITTTLSVYLIEGEAGLYDIGINFYRTFPLEQNMLFTLGLQNINYIGGGIMPMLGPSFGFAIGPENVFQVRPEFGALTDLSNLYFNYGIALVAFF